MATFRKELGDLLREVMPSNVRVIDSQRTLDRIDSPTLQIIHTGVAKTPAMPLAARDIEFTLNLLSPIEDIEMAEDELDNLIDEVLDALDRYPTANYSAAAKGVIGNLAGYSITLTLTIPKDQTNG